MYSKNVVVVTGNRDAIQFAVHTSPQKAAWEILSEGRSVLQLFAEVNENFYTVWIVAESYGQMSYLMLIVNQIIPLWVKDVGEEKIADCKVPQAWLENMRLMGSEFDD